MLIFRMRETERENGDLINFAGHIKKRLFHPNINDIR